MKRTPTTGDTSFLRKLLLTIMVIGATGSTFGAGTFASYNASASNSSSTFETGTLALSDLGSTNSVTCFSYGATASGFTNANHESATCDSLFNLGNTVPTAALAAANKVNITLQNKGDLNATTLTVTPGSCTYGDTASGYHGAGNLCSGLQFALWETASNFTTGVACRYGTASGNNCTLDASHTLSTFSSGGALTLTGGLNSNALRYFQLQVILPNTSVDQTLQGLKINTFSLTWSLT